MQASPPVVRAESTVHSSPHRHAAPVVHTRHPSLRRALSELSIPHQKLRQQQQQQAQQPPLPPPHHRPGTLEQHTLTRTMSSRPTMVTPEEYELLPPSIQKKYFSPVERLRIAQKYAALKRKKQQPGPSAMKEFPKFSLECVRPQTANAIDPTTQALSRKHLSSRSRRSDADVNEQQALRFLALPDKVKRSHFTQEELVLLTESSERALGTPSDLSVRDSAQSMSIRRETSVCSSSYRSSTSESWIGTSDRTRTRTRTSIGPPLDTFEDRSRFHDSVSSSSPRMSSISYDENTHSPSPRKYSTRKRVLSLAPLPLPPPTLRPLGSSGLGSKSVADSFDGDMESSPKAQIEVAPMTKHYKDSHARRKLREYLASPEKFDEALEFGFPSEPNFAPKRTISFSSNAEPSWQPDLESDSLSMTGSRDDGDRASVRSPRTPPTMSDTFSEPVGTYSSVDSGIALPYHMPTRKASTPNLLPDFQRREMTLRMTLTRSDLRAPEAELYSVQRRQVSGVDVETLDPLALQSLPFCDDHTGAHGAFAVATSPSHTGIKRVWENFRKRT